MYKSFYTLLVYNLLFVATAFGIEQPMVSPAETDSMMTMQIAEVVATGTRTQTDPRLLPVTVNVIDEGLLTEKQEPNLLPTLVNEVPGLFVTQRSMIGYGVSTGGSGGIKIRGIGGAPNTDILVLIDGLPQYAGLYGHPISDNYQTQMAERVEVIRGPASLYYGSNAMGGVINIVTHQPKRDTILTDLHLQGGSYYSLDAGASNRMRKGKYTHAIGVNYVRTDGHRANMHFDQTSAYTRFGYDISNNWLIAATGNINYFNTANPGVVTAPILESSQHVLRGMATLSAENHYDRTSGAVRAYYSGGRHKINEGHNENAAAPLTEYNHTELMLGVSAYQIVNFFRGNHTTFGFDFQHFGGHVWNRVIADNSEVDIIRKTQYELAGYIDFHQQLTEWFSFDVGTRVGWHSEAGIYYAPQAGLSFLLPHDAQLKAIISKGFRNPTIRELYMYAPANDSLQAVSLWNYEFSYKQYMLDGRLRLGANVFYLNAKNNIETVPMNGKPRNMNTGKIENAGAEVEISGRVWKGLMLSANYSYLYMRYAILASPEHKLNLSLGYHYERFRVGTSVQYIAGMYTSLDAKSEKEHFILWNAHAAFRIWKGLWVNLQADNLLGQEYEINAGYPMPRTTLMGGMRWIF